MPFTRTFFVLEFLLELMLMKNAFNRTFTGLFIVYLVLNGLVFFGQDLTVRKTSGDSWCVTLADHSHREAIQTSGPNDFNTARQHHSHEHQSDGVHICIEQHKVLGASDTSVLDMDHPEFSKTPVTESGCRIIAMELSHLPGFFQGSDPGPPLPDSPYSSILLL